jgi:hypothetical protein
VGGFSEVAADPMHERGRQKIRSQFLYNLKPDIAESGETGRIVNAWQNLPHVVNAMHDMDMANGTDARRRLWRPTMSIVIVIVKYEIWERKKGKVISWTWRWRETFFKFNSTTRLGGKQFSN